MSAEDTGLREAVERLVDEWESKATHAIASADARKGLSDESDLRRHGMKLRRRVRELRALLAEQQPTAREGASPQTYVVGGPDCPRCRRDGLTCYPDGGLITCAGGCDRCDDALDGRAKALQGAGLAAQPAPVAPAGELRLSKEERGALEQVVGNMLILDRTASAVERILAARLAAAEQRVREAQAEALEEAADAIRDSEGNAMLRALLNLACNDTARMTAEWAESVCRARAADLRAATTEGGEQRG